ncbi:MAG: hypothetical protein M3139_16985 [Bacteroidota bacterium]|nr:hypothetical protein [Bacteroidota bacterium]
MKKIIATILLALYFAASSGAVIEMHFCMGKFVAIHLVNANTEKEFCKDCGMEKKKGCCENKHHIIKTDKQYDVNNSPVNITAPINILATFFISNSNTKVFTTSYITFPLSNSPPSITNVPAYIINCTYLV